MKNAARQTMNKQTGFTLIELVVVIVILGILAVTAAPKFIDLQSDARTATLKAVKASMQSASALIHSKSLIAGVENDASAATSVVTVNGVQTQVNYGYPLADYTGANAANPGDWEDLLDLNTAEFTMVVVGTQFVVHPTGITAPSAVSATVTATNNCYAYYTEATSTTTPTYTVVDCL
ncbi:type II secretion system protein [Colwellia maritima]|uniref:type II secretion system protein n=1 Tax=Colwellia maritima TaxID=2912588 RepID=UPI00237AC74D|nr:type II secretion system protein [Colwellia maritima]